MKRTEQPATEFSRPLEVARVPNLGSHEKLKADDRECKALAQRLMLPAVHAVSAHLHAKPWRGGGLKVKGELMADIVQQSVVSLEEFRTTVTLPVERYFLNVSPDAALESEEDIDPIEGGIVDLGELVAETLALELDPYPRKPGEQFQSDVEDEPPTKAEKPNPFNVLKLPTKDR
jgi:uncharacterized metal-binding protein YceD (DUF177 family)